jgi:gamma-glutamylcyclotransferase (GGCT)/AIG2-like uncharacterized protein YtfP
MTRNLFVYGTLKTGGYFWQRALAPRIGVPDRCRNLRLFDLGRFPAAKLGLDSSDVVTGETFLDVSDEIFAMLDRIEGVPHLYQHAQLTTQAGHAVVVYVMESAHLHGDYLPEGVWHERR